MLLANCSDRAIRLFSLDKQIGIFNLYHGDQMPSEGGSQLIQPPLKFQDAVNRCGWSHVQLTPEGTLLIAATDVKDAHIIYLFDSLSGQVLHVLEDTREAVLAVTVLII
jgi:hypothetical protein